MEILKDELTYATEEVERLTKVLDEQNSLLQSSQEQMTHKEAKIKNLLHRVNSHHLSVNGVRNTVVQRKSYSCNIIKSTNLRKTFLYQLKQQEDAVERTIRNGSFNAVLEPAVTPKSLPRVSKHACSVLLSFFANTHVTSSQKQHIFCLFSQDALHSRKLQQGSVPSPGESGEGVGEPSLLHDDHGDSFSVQFL